MTNKPASQATTGEPESFARHTCNPRRPGQPLPFGRKADPGVCARCDQLHAGAAPRSAPAWVESTRRADAIAAAMDRDRRAHFAPGGPHSTGECGPICTFGDW